MKDYSKLTTIELDDLACSLSRKADSLEAAYTDFNGDWIDKARKREWNNLVKERDKIDRLLEERSDQ